MEGKTIVKVFDFNQAYQLIRFEDGSGMLVKMVSEISASDMEDLADSACPVEEGNEPVKTEAKKEEPKPSTSKNEEPKPSTSKKEEPVDDDITEEEVMEADFDALADLCDEFDLKIDPEDYDTEEIEELRKKVLIGLEFKTEADFAKETPAEEEEPVADDDELTWENIAEMDFDELGDLCNDEKLDTDPTDYGQDEEDELRRAIAKELGIEAPEKKRTRRRG